MPEHLKTDNVMPSISELPNFLSRVRHPRRSRSISIGPQSAADAHEALAFRREMRKQASTSGAATGSDAPALNRPPTTGDQKPQMEPDGQPIASKSPNQDQIVTFGENLQTSHIVASSEESTATMRSPSHGRRQNEKEEREIFSSIQKPRVRYDVEVITKLIVYSGKEFDRTFLTMLTSTRDRVDCS